MYIYTNEIFLEKSRKFNTVVWTSFYTLGGICVNLFSIRWNYFADYIWLSAVCVGVCSLSYWVFIESPFYLFGRGDVEGLTRCLAVMCRWNFPESERARKLGEVRSILAQLPMASEKSLNAEPLLEPTSQIQNIECEQPPVPNSSKTETRSNKPPKHSVVELFFTRTNVTRFVLVLCINFTGYMIFGLGVIFNKNLGISNIYLSGLLLTVPKLFSHLLTSVLVTRVRTRTLNIWVNAVILVLAAGLLLMNLIHNDYEPYAERSRLYRVAESGRLTSGRNTAGRGRKRDIRLYIHLHGGADRHQNQKRLRDTADVDRNIGTGFGHLRDRADGRARSEPDDLCRSFGSRVALRVDFAT